MSTQPARKPYPTDISDEASQRFSGTFSEDGKTITASWEKSVDGSKWEHDFDLTYTRVK